MTNVEFVGHTHAAVELNRVLTNEGTPFAHLNFERRQCFTRFAIVFLSKSHGRHIGE